jgi:hypothetical protein
MPAPGLGNFGPPAGGGGPFSRFTKHIVIGAVIGGLLSSVPLLNIANCCFCLLNMTGVAIGLMLYLNANPGESLTSSEAAGFGAAAGAGAGVLAGIGSIVTGALVRDMMAGFLTNMPPQLAQQMAAQSTWGFFAIPVDMALYGAFGALGGFLSMQLFFKTRLRP